jgi:hypothetical protein
MGAPSVPAGVGLIIPPRFVAASFLIVGPLAARGGPT